MNAKEFLVDRGYVSKDENISVIMEEYFEYKLSNTIVDAPLKNDDNRTPLARTPASNCKSCKKDITRDEHILKFLNDENPRKNSVTVCSDCGTETPFIHD
jgi:hypothetical protein